MEFISKYKCEYCGEVFSGGITGSEKLAFQGIIIKCVSSPWLSNKLKDIERNTFPYKEPHITQDHYGIGRLIGVVIVGGENDEKEN